MLQVLFSRCACFPDYDFLHANIISCHNCFSPQVCQHVSHYQHFHVKVYGMTMTKCMNITASELNKSLTKPQKASLTKPEPLCSDIFINIFVFVGLKKQIKKNIGGRVGADNLYHLKEKTEAKVALV